MTAFKNFLRIMIVAGSVGGFLGGWATLAHAGKPAQPAESAPPGQVAPAQSAPLSPQSAVPGRRRSGSLQPFQVQPQLGGGFLPRLRSGGS